MGGGGGSEERKWEGEEGKAEGVGKKEDKER